MFHMKATELCLYATFGSFEWNAKSSTNLFTLLSNQTENQRNHEMHIRNTLILGQVEHSYTVQYISLAQLTEIITLPPFTLYS